MNTGLQEISFYFANTVKNHTEYRVIPGKSICPHCQIFLNEFVLEVKEAGKQFVMYRRNKGKPIPGFLFEVKIGLLI